MKHKLSFFLTFLIVFGLLEGCSAKKPDGAYTFYYCQAQYQYDTENGVLATQYYTPPTNATEKQILQKYFAGTVGKDQFYPFPEGTKFLSLETNENRAIILLSTELASLSKMDLTMACACITLTVYDITGCSTVEIRANDALLNNQKSVVMDANNLILSDFVSAQ